MTFLETEVDAITNFNDSALKNFTAGSAVASLAVNILIGYALASAPLTELGDFVVKYGTCACVLVGAIFWYAGYRDLTNKNSLIKQIKKEHGIDVAG